MPVRPTLSAPWLFLGYLAFVVYGSLVPLDFQPLPWDQALEQFAKIPYLNLGVDSRADWVANGVLYVPLGFFASMALTAGRCPAPSAFFLSVSLGGVVAVAVEFTQLYFPPRTVSQNDLMAEFIGTVLGAALAPVAGPWLARARLAWVDGADRSWLRVLEAYTVAYLALCFFPYDILLSQAELADKVASILWGWAFAASDRGSLIVGLQLLVETALCVPVGVLLALRSPRRQGQTWRALSLGLLLGVGIELGQFFIASGVSQGASVLTRMVGVAAGAWAAPHVARAGVVKLREWVRQGNVVILLAYVPVLLVANGWGRASWQGLHGARMAWADLRWLPFYYHYFTTEALALFSLGSVALMYLPLAALAWSRAWSATPAALAVGAVCALVEVSKLFLVGQHPDPTNVLIVVVVTLLTLQLANKALRPRAAAEADRYSSENRASENHASLVLTQGALARGAVARAAMPALVILGAVVWAVRFPAFPWALFTLLLFCAAAVWRRPAWALLIIPAAMPILDLAPWSGRLYLDEFDLLTAVCLAAAWLGLGGQVGVAQKARISTLTFGLLALSLVLSTLRALWPWPALDPNSFVSYFSVLNALRIAKGAFWAWLFVTLYQRVPEGGKQRERLFGAGMGIGLLATLGVVLWERASFVNLFDFAADYRVTGPFSAMHKGGAYIECYLAVGAAYVLSILLRANDWPRRVGAALLLALTSYAVAVTYSRNGYAALAVVLTLGLLVLPGPGRRDWRRWALAGIACSMAAGVALMVLRGGFAQERLTQSVRDLGVRAAHWADALSLRDDDVATAVLGMGIGRFPETHHWRSKELQLAPSLRLEKEVGATFVRLGAGAPTYLEQFVAPQPGETLLLGMALRSKVSPFSLNVSLCRKWLLTSDKCERGVASAAPASSASGAWQNIELSFDTQALAELGRWSKLPLKLSLHLPASGLPVDVKGLHLRAAQGPELLRNGDFSSGLDHWLFTTDIDPPWHIHSLPVAVLFDQGLLGLVAWAGVIAVALMAGWLRARQGAVGAATALVAVSGFLTSATLNTLIDAPRFLWLLLVLLWLCSCRDGTVHPSQRSGQAQDNSGHLAAAP